jgi:hypothetical protein
LFAAAGPVEALRTPLLDELEDLLGTFSSLVRPAQNAVVRVVASLLADPESMEAERDLATALLVLARIMDSAR